MKKLLRGIVEFRNRVRPGYRESFARLALGQSPDALLVACSDSRVVPNLFASTEPGDLFVLRSVGNIVAPCGEDQRSVGDESEAATIEYALHALDVRDVIVCGHSECGAMRALLGGPVDPEMPHLAAWLRHADVARARFEAGARMTGNLPAHDHVSQLNVLAQLEHLETYPIVRDRLASGSLRLHGWWFDIAQAEVHAFGSEAHGFVVIDDAKAEALLAELENARRAT